MAKKSTRTASETKGEAANFSKLASDLITKWSGTSGWADRAGEPGAEIDQSKLELALDVLTGVGRIGGIDLTALKAATDAAARIGLVEDAIMNFQGQQMLDVKDGILGIKTWKRLRQLKACPKADDARKKELDEDSLAKLFNSRRKKGFIFYHIDTRTVPGSIGGVETSRLIVDAWNLWQQWADFTIVDETRPENANVIILFRRLGDGVGGTLGIAHIGGPSRLTQQLECAMDMDELWTPSKFRTAICHELGHILGLTHDDASGQLMSPFLDESISKPMPNDQARIKGLWGARDDGGFVEVDPEDADDIPGGIL